jgi:hypothetical protein
MHRRRIEPVEQLVVRIPRVGAAEAAARGLVACTGLQEVPERALNPEDWALTLSNGSLTYASASTGPSSTIAR